MLSHQTLGWKRNVLDIYIELHKVTTTPNGSNLNLATGCTILRYIGQKALLSWPGIVNAREPGG